MSSKFENLETRLVPSDNASLLWSDLALAVQILFPLALAALLFSKKLSVYPLRNYVSVLWPSVNQKQRLLTWLSTRIPYMSNLPKKISQYWKDGSLLCTLINTAIPGACPNPQRHWKQPPMHAQALAYKYFGVAPALTSSDFAEQKLTSTSERKFVNYLLALQEVIGKFSTDAETLKFTNSYIARGMGLIIGEQGKPSTFYLYPNADTKKLENIFVSIKGPYSSYGKLVISSGKMSQNAKRLAKMRKEASSEKKKLSYRSNSQKYFFKPLSFDIGPILGYLSRDGRSGDIGIKVDMEKDRAKVSFVPGHSGIYELHLTTNDEHLHGSPFIVRVTKPSGDDRKDVKDLRFTELRKVISKNIDFIDESVDVTEENKVFLKLDQNNNQDDNAKNEKIEAIEIIQLQTEVTKEGSPIRIIIGDCELSNKETRGDSTKGSLKTENIFDQQSLFDEDKEFERIYRENINENDETSFETAISEVCKDLTEEGKPILCKGDNEETTQMIQENHDNTIKESGVFKKKVVIKDEGIKMKKVFVDFEDLKLKEPECSCLEGIDSNSMELSESRTEETYATKNDFSELSSRVERSNSTDNTLGRIETPSSNTDDVSFNSEELSPNFDERSSKIEDCFSFSRIIDDDLNGENEPSRNDEELLENKPKTKEWLSRNDLMKTKNDLMKTKHDFVRTKYDLVKTKNDLTKTKFDLAVTKNDLLKTRNDLAKTKHDLLKTKDNLLKPQNELPRSAFQEEMSSSGNEIEMKNHSSSVIIDDNSLGSVDELCKDQAMKTMDQSDFQGTNDENDCSQNVKETLGDFETADETLESPKTEDGLSDIKPNEISQLIKADEILLNIDLNFEQNQNGQPAKNGVDGKIANEFSNINDDSSQIESDSSKIEDETTSSKLQYESIETEDEKLLKNETWRTEESSKGDFESLRSIESKIGEDEDLKISEINEDTSLSKVEDFATPRNNSEKCDSDEEVFTLADEEVSFNEILSGISEANGECASEAEEIAPLKFTPITLEERNQKNEEGSEDDNSTRTCNDSGFISYTTDEDSPFPTSRSIRNMVELFESNKSSEDDVVSKKASPVSHDIEPEVVEVNVEDSALPREENQISGVNVFEIKLKFEKKIQDSRKSQNSGANRNLIKKSRVAFTQSMPNLAIAKDEYEKESFLSSTDSTNEFVMQFKEKKLFWDKLAESGSTASLGSNYSDVDNIPKWKINDEKNVLKSTKSLSSIGRSCEHLVNVFNEEKGAGSNVVFEKIKVFEKDFDSERRSIVLKRTKEKSVRSLSSFKSIKSSEGIQDIHDLMHDQPVLENLQFAEESRQRFESARHFFRSIEQINLIGKSHGASEARKSPRRSVSLKTLNVQDRFALDNLYRDVIFNKIRNGSLRGSPNRDGVVGTLASISSTESGLEKDFGDEEDIDLGYFRIARRPKRRKSVKSLFDVNY